MTGSEYYEQEFNEELLNVLNDIRDDVSRSKYVDITFAEALSKLAEEQRNTNDSIKSMLDIVTEIKLNEGDKRNDRYETTLADIANNVDLLVKTIVNNDNKTRGRSGEPGVLDKIFGTDRSDTDRSDTLRNVAGHEIKSLMTLMLMLTSTKRVEEFDKNVDAYNLTIDKLIGKFEELHATLSVMENSIGVIDSIARVMDRGRSILANAGTQMLMLSISIAAFTATMALASWPLIAKGAIVFSGAMILITGAMFVASKFFDDTDMVKNMTDNMLSLSKSMLFLAVGIAAFALVVTFLPVKSVMLASVVMVGVAIGIALAAKIAGPASRDLGYAMLGVSASLILFAVSLLAFEAIIEHVSFASFTLAAGSLLVLTAAVRLIGNSSVHTLKGIAVIAAMTIALYALPFVLREWRDITAADTIAPALALGGLLLASVAVSMIGRNKQGVIFGLAVLGGITLALLATRLILHTYRDVTLEDIEVPALVLGGMLAAAGILSLIGKTGPAALLGMLPILAITASMLLMYPVINKLKDITTEQLEVPALILGGMLVAAGIASAIGLLGPAALIGLAVIAGIAGSMWIAAKTLTQFVGVAKLMENVDVNPEHAKRIVASVGILAGGLALIGNPLTLPLLVAGTAATLAISKAIDTLADGLTKTERINLNVATNNGKALVNWSKQTIKELGSLNVKEIAKSAIAVKSLRGLGTTMALIASGITAMANGTYTEYGIVNGEQVPIAVHQIGPDTYAKYGDAIHSLLGAITDPIERIGSTGNLLFSTDFERGLTSLRHLPDVVLPMVEISKHSDAIRDADYTGFGVSVDNLIQHIQKPIENIGVGSNRFWNNDFESGLSALSKISIIVNPMLEIAKHGGDIATADYTGFSTAVDNLVSNIHKPISEIGKGSGFFRSNRFKAGLKALSNLTDVVTPMVEIANSADLITGTNFGDVGVKFDMFISSIIDPLETIAKSNIDSGLSKLQGIGNLVQPMSQVSDMLMNFEKNKQIETLLEVAYAIDTLSDISLPRISAMKENMTNELYGKLDRIIEAIGNMDKNQLKALQSLSVTEGKSEETKQHNKITPEHMDLSPFDITVGQEIDLTHVYRVLTEIYNKIPVKRYGNN